MRRAIELSRRCPPAAGAFSVGAILVDAAGQEIARGHSREGDPVVHAEEAALAKVPKNDPRLATATLYSTLEPCSERKSRPVTCADHVIRAGLRRVVIAWMEPSLLVADCVGVEQLRAAGVLVTELAALADEARAVNAHLLT
ncbi:deaminase (plasmid) [Streptomyces sp. NBC_00212]